MKVKLLVSVDTQDNLLVADARNILFNYLFARHHHGQMLIRVDDLKRDVGSPREQKKQIETKDSEAIEASDASETPLEKPSPDPLGMIDWLGLRWEPAQEPDVPNSGMLRQSDRLELYRQYADRILDSGKAYRCFCSRDSLRDMYIQQKIRGQSPHYDGRCLRLPPYERDAYLKEGRPFQVRLTAPEVVTEVHDVNRGRLVFDPRGVANLVIMHYQRIPTWALANVVDCQDLQITHVVRGDRLKSQTPREAFLRQAFGFKDPEYAHLPLVLGEDRSLLSERHGDKCIEDYKANGYLPEALINCLACQGLPLEDHEHLRSLGTLARHFRMEKNSRDPTVWDIEVLQAFNRMALDALKDDSLVQMLAPYVAKTGHDLFARGAPWAKEFVCAIRPGLKTLSDVKDSVDTFFAERLVPTDKGQTLLKDSDARRVVDGLEEVLEDLEGVTQENYRGVLDAVRSRISNRGKALILIRVALTGRDIGPEFSKLLPLLGKQLMLARLENARRYIPRGTKQDQA